MCTDTLTVAAPTGTSTDVRTMPLTWAQAGIWQAVWEFGDDARHLVMSLPVQLPGPLPEPTVRDVLAAVCGRYDVVRTRFPWAARHQLVEHAVDLPVLILESDASHADGVARVTSALNATPFDPQSSPPLRVGLLREAGRVHAVVLAFSHLSFDIAGARILRGHIATALAHPETRLPRARQTDELVLHEGSDDARSRSDATITRWERAMRATAPGPGVRPVASGSYPVLQLRSTELASAAQALSTRLRVSTGSVVLAGVVRAFAAETGAPPPMWQLIVGNRHHASLADLVGITVQNGPFTTPQSALTTGLQDLVGPVHRGAVNAYLNARYDTDALRRRVDVLTAEGDACDLSYFFNDTRPNARGWEESPIDPAFDRDLAAEPRVIAERATSDVTAFVSLGADGPAAVLTLQVDEATIERGAAGKILGRVRDEVVGAVVGSAPA